jgi:hypothetical protein
MRRLAFALAVLSATAAAFVACVGDSSTTPPTADAAAETGAPDALADTAAPDVRLDAGSDARCDRDAAFGNVEPVPELNSASDDISAFLSSDELTIDWYTARDAGGWFTSTRKIPSGPFPAPAVVPDLNAANAGSVWFSPDVKTALVVTGGYQVQLATRATLQDKFANFAPIAAVNAGGINYSATMRGDGKEIFFGSPRSGPQKIYTATGSGVSFGTPQVWDQDAPSGSDSAPLLSRDGLTLYFGSSRPGGAGGFDLWMARRPSLGAKFDPPVNLASASSKQSDEPTWISDDECVLYFNRGSVGGRDIYRATR